MQHCNSLRFGSPYIWISVCLSSICDGLLIILVWGWKDIMKIQTAWFIAESEGFLFLFTGNARQCRWCWGTWTTGNFYFYSIWTRVQRDNHDHSELTNLCFLSHWCNQTTYIPLLVNYTPTVAQKGLIWDYLFVFRAIEEQLDLSVGKDEKEHR